MRQKNISLLLLSFLFVHLSMHSRQIKVGIIPQPQSIRYLTGQFELDGSLAVKTRHDDFKKLLAVKGSFVDYSGTDKKNKQHKLNLVFDKSLEPEAYQLNITTKGIEIRASEARACFYGLKSLEQMLYAASKMINPALPCVEINDKPRYGWRGLMLDESRHFFGADVVKQIIDMMALQKLNKFHWHLTDEPGWRIEIKKYPKLTTVGGKGNFTDANADARYYTQEEIKEIVQYAGDRFIEVIPEIDMPGHASAANRAYPEFDGGGNEKHPNFTFHPGKEKTYAYLTNILREVSELFPSQYIHLGGDEVHFGNDKWAKDSQVKDLMTREKLHDIKAVEHYFLNRMSDSIAGLNKSVAAWDEVISANLPSRNTLVMWWRHDKPNLLKKALEENYQVVMCPRRPLYFDFVQHDTHRTGRRWSGFCPLDMVYAFPNKETTGGEYYLDDKVIGLQANVWTETIHTPERLQFMMFPRLSAVAEAGWTYDVNKDYESFKKRLKAMLAIYKKEGISYFDVFSPLDHREVDGPKKRK